MGYFDGLTDVVFKIDRQGRHLFYPWGTLGRGYILPNTQKKQQIRNFVKLYYIVSLPTIIVVTIAVEWMYAFALLPVGLLWYILTIRRLLRGLEVTQDKLSLAESYTNSAKSHSLETLWLMLVCSILFVLAGIWILSEGQWLLGLASIIFFGTGSFFFGYMIKARNT